LLIVTHVYSGYGTGIYMTNSPDACHHIADNARCNIIVVDDDEQLQKILSIRDRLPHLKAIVQYRGQPDKRLKGVYSVKFHPRTFENDE
jgi:long-chain-fatty-acid--CoA ligase ACSBG